MPLDSDFFVKFWGVRGSIPCPGPDTAIYGGNTPCVEIRCGSNVLIFDAGTGIRPLGNILAADNVRDVDLFLTHTHLDHINGFPMFNFLFDDKNHLKIWAGRREVWSSIKDIFEKFMAPPIWPLSIENLGAEIIFSDFEIGQVFSPKPGIIIRTVNLNHPQGAVGYRVDFSGKSICYVTDTEHAKDCRDQNILKLIEGADIVIYDASFTDEEYPNFVGWGHSTWQEGVRLCTDAGAQRLAVFHHLPGRSDDELAIIDSSVGVLLPGSVVAREGMVLAP
ncbi:MAG: MBL fold metallo-hydrolase [Pseudomonadota bacterium]|nr:MBL fold metallo-hydrolase [Pseudomonadota bacterium]MEC8725800.1 MBL fold metallo-hydrolase [Pseudomonadota bacterium]|tara:strand:- start:624 stop:1457 length:834 start_codon:yes stop_codon:yes gene_type:complete